MYISHLSLTDFRSYAQADFELGPGTTVFVGSNGVGKTNIAEAIGYLASLSSHRVSTDAPLIRFGADRALVRARVARAGQATAVELEITAGKANRARINRANPVRARDILGIVRTVLFAPEDLALVKGDPSNRRRFLDDLLVALRPHHAATRGDYERVLKQRNALLKSVRKGRFTAAHESTLEVWDQHLAQAGARLLRGRLDVLELLSAHLGAEYAGLTDGSKAATARYRCTVVEDLDDDGGAMAPAGPAELDSADLGPAEPAPAGHDAAERETADQQPAGSDRNTGAVRTPGLEGAGTEDLERMFLAALVAHRKKETDRGLTLVGPHRDELELSLGPAPAKGYASHGETWSLALALRLAAYRVLCEDDPREGAGPILILDDVFAELDTDRRSRLAAVVAGAEQVIVTAAVAADVPGELGGRVLRVTPGHVSP